MQAEIHDSTHNTTNGSKKQDWRENNKIGKLIDVRVVYYAGAGS